MAGGAAAAAFLDFFLRMQNHARKPMSARPTIGPTTTPAIQALLEDSFFASGMSVGTEALPSPAPSVGVAAGVEPGCEGPIQSQLRNIQLAQLPRT